MTKKPKIIVIVGPTASGKTALAIKIARRFHGKIVSADSRQIYRGMDIGTAKPSKKEMQIVPHYLIDIKNPDENYTVAEYKRDAIKAIRKILKKNALPILVGGTGLYVKAVIDNLNIPNVPPDYKLRRNLEKEIKEKGLNSVFQKLIGLDPEAAYIVDPNNPRRVIRALEIALKTKKPFSAQHRSGKPLFDYLEIGIETPREKLNQRIGERIDLMMKAGLVNEVRDLTKKYGVNCQSFDAIGYREIIDYLNGKLTLAEAAELMKKNTRNYAKRQMTWFRKNKRTYRVKNENKAISLVRNFLSIK